VGHLTTRCSGLAALAAELDIVRRARAVVNALIHELWDEGNGAFTFCLRGPLGQKTRELMAPGAHVIWTVRAGSHFEAMSRYHEHMGWPPYTTEHTEDREPYPEAWFTTQSG
jgi:hypothetical protein